MRLQFPRCLGAFAALYLAADCATVRHQRPDIEHVFVIELENEGYDTTFRAGTDAPYLADTLTKQGTLLRQYYGIGHFSLDNYIAMVSGLAPTTQTQSDCFHYDDFVETGMADYDSTSSGLPHLGYAGLTGLRPFGSDVFTRLNESH